MIHLQLEAVLAVAVVESMTCALQARRYADFLRTKLGVGWAFTQVPRNAIHQDRTDLEDSRRSQG